MPLPPAESFLSKRRPGEPFSGRFHGPSGSFTGVEGDALLATIDEAEVEGLILIERTLGPRVIANARGFDFDELAPRSLRSLVAEKAVQHMCQIDCEQTRKGPAGCVHSSAMVETPKDVRG